MEMELWKLEFPLRSCSQVSGEGMGVGAETWGRKLDLLPPPLNLLFHPPGYPIARSFRNGELDPGYQIQ